MMPMIARISNRWMRPPATFSEKPSNHNTKRTTTTVQIKLTMKNLREMMSCYLIASISYYCRAELLSTRAVVTGTQRRQPPALRSYDQVMDLANVRQRLEDERARRLALAERLRGEEAKPVESSELSKIDQHPAELGTETFERELELTTRTIVEGGLKDVDDALRRLDSGTYGICEECGKPIDEARLEAVPWARYCVVDQARLGKEGTPPKPGFCRPPP